MQINAAITKLKQMSNHFQVFKDAEELIELLSQAENLKASSERELVKLKEEINVSRETGEKEHARIKKKTDELLAKLLMAEKEGQEKLLAAKEDYKSLTQQAQSDLSKLKKDFADKKKLISLEMAELLSQKAGAEKELSSLRNDIERIKAQVSQI